MAKRAGFWLVCCVVILACLQNVGCTGTPAKFNAVVLTPSTPQTIGTGTSLLITATVSNDTSGAGVTWSAPANGTLSGVTTTSAVYNAPAVAPGASITDTVKATSVTYPTQFASLSITVQGSPLITTTSLPGGNWGSPYSATVTGTGGVPPFTWSISSGSLTTGLSLGASTTNSVTISGTPGAQVDSNFTIKMTDSTGAFATQALTIAIGAPLQLKVTTTTLPNGTVNAAYPSTTLQASGGVPPFTWALATGSNPLPAGLSLASDGTISGTPTASGAFNFTVQVTDSQATTATANLSIQIKSQLSGNYAFEFSGFNAAGPVVVAGSFAADGLGNITAGVEDFNTAGGTPKNQTFTGTFTLGSDGRGQLIFSSLAGSPTYDFAIDPLGVHGRMIEFDSSGIRGSGELAQQTTSTCAFNTLSGGGPAGTDFAIGLTGAEASFAGTTPGPFVLAGRFTAEVPANSSTPGAIDNGEVDANAPGNQTVMQGAFSGSFQASPQAARCTMSVTQTLSITNFSVYPVSSANGLLTEAFIVETDPVSAATPFLSVGKLMHQTGYPFASAYQSFSAESAGGLSGAVIPSGQNAYVPFAAIAQLQGGGGTAFTLSLVDNVGGTVRSALGANVISATFNMGDAYGRVDTTLVDTNPLVPIEPVFYVINNNEALCILENVNAPVLGILEPQSKGGAGSFSASTIGRTLVQGTSAPAASAVQNFSGVTTLTNTTSTTGTVAGTQDLSTTGGNTAGLAISGNYALTATGATDGSGTLSLTQTPPPPLFNGAFFIISPTKAVMITTTNGDTNPVLTILGEQLDDFGVN